MVLPVRVLTKLWYVLVGKGRKAVIWMESLTSALEREQRVLAEAYTDFAFDRGHLLTVVLYVVVDEFGG